MDGQTKGTKCPVMKNTDLSGNSEEVYQKRISPDCSSLQESEEHQENENGASLNSSNLMEEKKGRRKTRGGKRHNRCKKTASQDPPLSTGPDNSGLMAMVSENNASCLKPKGRRKKQAKNKISIMTNSVSVEDAKRTDGECVNSDNGVEKSCEVGRNNLDCTSTEKTELQEQGTTCLSKDHNVNCLNASSLAEVYMEKLRIVFSPRQSLSGFPKKKLLILDLNGLLADINQDYHNAHMADAKVRGKLVFRRPYCDDFLNFCAWNFELGIWSSRKKRKCRFGY
uniref:Mitochondrial import inner membrane translocase subunit TIM50 n=1 Tax=Arundo donax TaxID=35708 RepID=A0A0A9D386_ARUDO